MCITACHYFDHYNPDIRKYAAEALAHPDRFDKLIAQALVNRKDN